MLGADPNSGYIDVAQEDVVVVLGDESLKISHNNCLLRGLYLEFLPADTIFSPMQLTCRDLEEHVVLEIGFLYLLRLIQMREVGVIRLG